MAQAAQPVQDVKRLHIKEETRITLQSPAPIEIKAFDFKLSTPHPLSESTVNKSVAALLKKVILQKSSHKQVSLPEGNSKAFPTLNVPALSALKESKLELQKVDELSASQKILLEALIAYESDQHPAIALALIQSIIKDTQIQNEVYLLAAKASYDLGIKFESYSYIRNIFESKNKSTSQETKFLAYQFLNAHAKDYNYKDVPKWITWNPYKDSEFKSTIALEYQKARFFLETGDLEKSLHAIDKILAQDSKHPEAYFLRGLLNYRRGQVDAALADLNKANEYAEKESDTKAKALLTIARIQFQKSDYAKADETYRKVNRTSSVWLQAMTEQAWAQVLEKDYEGAAGNMFTLHTDFFKSSFAPESYLVRSIAYLNLCQFGDGSQVLNQFSRRYEPTLKTIVEYQKAHTKDADYLETLKTWMQKDQAKVVDNLPKSVIKEWAINPEFRRIQKRINNLIDEEQQWDQAQLSVLEIEKTLNQRKRQLIESIAHKKENTLTNLSLAELQGQKDMIEIKIKQASKARVNLKALKAFRAPENELEKNRLKADSAKALAKQTQDMMKALKGSIDQTDRLRYELLSGAGEHLRLQAEGGKIDSKSFDQKKESVNLKWKFQGELWEDELGHVRSSLKNVCGEKEALAMGK